MHKNETIMQIREATKRLKKITKKQSLRFNIETQTEVIKDSPVKLIASVSIENKSGLYSIVTNFFELDYKNETFIINNKDPEDFAKRDLKTTYNILKAIILEMEHFKYKNSVDCSKINTIQDLE